MAKYVNDILFDNLEQGKVNLDQLLLVLPGVDKKEVEAEIATIREAKAAAAAAAARMEALATLRKKVEGFSLPTSVIRLAQETLGTLENTYLQVSLVKDGEEIKVNMSLVDGGIRQAKAASSGAEGSSTRTGWTYFHKGVEVEGKLTAFVRNAYPASKASKALLDAETKRKAGQTVGLNAWQAIQADPALKSLFTRVAKG